MAAFTDTDLYLVRQSLSFLDRIRIVLVEPSFSGNIGSAARAMKTMGLTHLSLVNPPDFMTNVAMARAAGAHGIMMKASVADSLEAAVADCQLVIGASARSRAIPWPLVNPRQAASLSLQQSDDVEIAIVFGRERSGLTNGELALCHHHVHIPSNPEYSSLNVAAAVQVLAYEMRMAMLGDSVDYQWDTEREAPPANQAQMSGYFEHLEKTLIDIEYLDPHKPKLLMTRLRRLYMRVQPDNSEMNILRGILTQVDKLRAKLKD
jgi:tRNA (cytidine32/uridine32-2'-O)-methyltransferase